MASFGQKVMDWSLGVVSFATILMYAFLPLGIFGNNLDFKHFLLPKVIVSVIVALISARLYSVFFKARKPEPEVYMFGLVTTIGITALLTYVLLDLGLKLVGLY